MLRRRSFPQFVVLLVASAGAGDCIGPSAVRYTRLRYNDVVRATNDEQLLINIVRLRYGDSPIFIDLPNITSQFELTINDSNDVPNAPGATTLLPIVPEDNSLYLRGIRIIAALRARDATELEFGTDEDTDGSSEPIPMIQVQGRDLLSAAKDGYVYRPQAQGRVTLLKREKRLYLRVRDPYVHSPEMAEMARIFRLTPGLSQYQIKSELSDEAKPKVPSPLVHDTLYLNMRSVLQIMTFLSKGVCVPEEHVRSGIAPSTPDADGQPYDWTRITGGNFGVYAQKHRPRAAEVAVPYRGYWFYIAPDDVKSRSVLAILEILFAL